MSQRRAAARAACAAQSGASSGAAGGCSTVAPDARALVRRGRAGALGAAAGAALAAVRDGRRLVVVAVAVVLGRAVVRRRGVGDPAGSGTGARLRGRFVGSGAICSSLGMISGFLT